MSQAIPAITIQANEPYDFTVPESPAPAAYLIVTNTGLVPVQWNTGQSSGYIPNGTTLAISAGGAGTIVTFTATAVVAVFITVWTINDGPVFVPQGSPITEVNLAAGATVELAAGTTVDINNVADGTINIDEIASGNSLGALAVENNPLTPLSAPTITNVGTAGTTSYFYQQRLVNQFGKTIASPVGSTFTGNATLDSTNYNNVAVQGLVVPSGIGGNLVYDSNLANAIASEGATWGAYNSALIGSGNGKWNVTNPDTNSAAWTYTGSGSASGADEAIVDLAPLTIDSSNPIASVSISGLAALTSGSVFLAFQTTPGGSSTLGYIQIPSGSVDGVYHFTVAPGTGYIQLLAQNAVVTAGAVINFTQIQLTKTPAVQPYQPGPLWTIQTMRNGFWVPDMDTTLLVASDQGQAASNKVFSPFDSSGQMLQVYSTEIDSVLSPIDDVLPGFNGNGSTLSLTGPVQYSSPSPTAWPGDFFFTIAANTWYIFITFTGPTLIKQILAQLYTSSVTSPVILFMMIVKTNGRRIYLGSHLFITLIDLFEMLGTTGIEVDEGDQLWLASTIQGEEFMVDVAVKYL